MGKLTGRVALISGGNSGIGAATARLFAAEGAAVMIAARNADKAAALVNAIERDGGRAAFVPCDVRDPAACDRAAAAALEHFGTIDILFNNAGIVTGGTALTTSDAVWHDTFASNVHGLFYLTRAALPSMIAQRHGVIVNNASDWGLVGAQNALAYAASKGAVVQITRSLALDHGRDGIRVNAVCPGDTVVERWRETGYGGEGAAATPEAFAAYVDELGSAFALGRVGQADEIARAVLFLASDDSSYMTGALLTVDGGNTAGGSSARF